MKNKQKYFDEEERQMIEDYEKGEFVEVDNVAEEKKRFQAAAAYTLNLRKNKNINIRLPEKDLKQLKNKALKNGLPYQTLVATLLHQYVNDKLKVQL